MCIVAEVDHLVCEHKAIYIYECQEATFGPEGFTPCSNPIYPESRPCYSTHCSSHCCEKAWGLASADVAKWAAEYDKFGPPANFQSILQGSDKVLAARLVEMLQSRTRALQLEFRLRRGCPRFCTSDRFRAIGNPREPEIDNSINTNSDKPQEAPRPVAWCYAYFDRREWKQHVHWPRVKAHLCEHGYIKRWSSYGAKIMVHAHGLPSMSSMSEDSKERSAGLEWPDVAVLPELKYPNPNDESMGPPSKRAKKEPVRDVLSY
jgi:hypothetical protein